jgi:AcrR family transcriptional regulator
VPKASRNPLQLDTPERRALLTSHFVLVVEDLLDDGTAYSDISVERLIRAGSISRATFYAYYQNKGGLLQAMAEDVTQEISDAGSSWWEVPPSMGQAGLREALRPSVLAYLKHKTLLRAVAEASAYDEDVRTAYGALMTDTVGKLSQHIAAEQAAGRAYAGLDQDFVATWLVWMLERGLYHAVSLAADEDVERWLESLTDIIWRTLYEGFR